MIKTEEEYEEILSRITKLMDVDPKHNPQEAEELDRLVSEVEEYEERFYPIEGPKRNDKQGREIMERIRRWKVKKTKWRSRRLVIGAIWAVGLNFAFYWCASRGLDVEWFKAYIGYFTLGAMFFGGYLTATDMIDRWKR